VGAEEAIFHDIFENSEVADSTTSGFCGDAEIVNQSAWRRSTPSLES